MCSSASCLPLDGVALLLYVVKIIVSLLAICFCILSILGIQETDDVMMNGGIITYSKEHLKYLGTFISYNLGDDYYDVDRRIAAASKAMGALKLFFNKKEVRSQYVFLIFMAIPNTNQLVTLGV